MVRQEVCIGVERFGEVWSHPVRQSWRGGDVSGHEWWVSVRFGSLGQVRFRLVRLGWAGLHWNGSVWIGKLGIEMVRQSGIGLVV